MKPIEIIRKQVWLILARKGWKVSRGPDKFRITRDSSEWYIVFNEDHVIMLRDNRAHIIKYDDPNFFKKIKPPPIVRKVIDD